MKFINTNSPSQQKNVYGRRALLCSSSPMTGFLRNGCCDTNEDDAGSHTVCVELSDAFLAFSKKAGNDLSTPRPEHRFAGLCAGERWCLCAARWLEAHQAGAAPRVYLESTNLGALEIISIDLLKSFALDMN